VFNLEPGSTLDGYAIGDCIHEGAMGRLYSVAGGGADFPLLMKVPFMGAADSGELLLAFETEAMVLPRLEGPHVPRFVAAGDLRTVPYIVLERIAGSSLDHRERGAMPAAEVARVGAAIADALHDIHAQGVVHHDLKPDNVVLRGDGRAVLLDFALAYHRDLPDMLAEEQRFAAGSAPYLSPEQLRATRGDPRSDLFALGVLLYELATDQLPFGAPQTSAGWRDRLWRVPVPPAAIVKGFPPWLQEVILRCLEPETERRYQSAAHVAFDLRNPEGVPLTARANRRRAAGFTAQASRWLQSRKLGLPERPVRTGGATVVLVAVDTMHPDDPRQPEIRRVTRRILALRGEFRLICVSVIPAGPEFASEGDMQLEHRIRLRHWTEPLGIPSAGLTLHVLESPDPAGALLEFARGNHVDLIVIGAPAPDERAMAWWRSVASSVTANAQCSVHVVRRPQVAFTPGTPQ